jgi:hypothetical protein
MIVVSVGKCTIFSVQNDTLLDARGTQSPVISLDEAVVLYLFCELFLG